MSGLAVGIVGASGAVGRTMLRVLEEGRYLTVGKLRLYGSQRSAGRSLTFHGEQVRIERATSCTAMWRGLDVVLMSAGSGPSRRLAPTIASTGALVVDNSSAWRMDPRVPLVVPEVNPEALRSVPQGIVANPNCSTIQLVVAIAPLLRLAPLREGFVATYQAISGAGTAALEAFERQRAARVTGADVSPGPLGAILVDNVLMHWPFEGPHQREEAKIVRESRRILGREDLRLHVTTVRVPVAIGHAEAVTLRFDDDLPAERARTALREAPGLLLLDPPEAPERLPTPLRAAGGDEVLVGRVRNGFDGERDTLSLWVVADNLRKGAATNAVQIAAHLC